MADPWLNKASYKCCSDKAGTSWAFTCIIYNTNDWYENTVKYVDECPEVNWIWIIFIGNHLFCYFYFYFSKKLLCSGIWSYKHTMLPIVVLWFMTSSNVDMCINHVLDLRSVTLFAVCCSMYTVACTIETFVMPLFSIFTFICMSSEWRTQILHC